VQVSQALLADAREDEEERARDEQRSAGGSSSSSSGALLHAVAKASFQLLRVGLEVSRACYIASWY
jgi:hypothetical protein